MKIRSCAPDFARAFFARMEGVDKWDWSGGVLGVDDMIGGGTPFEVVANDGTLLAVFVVQRNEYAHGCDLEIRLALEAHNRVDLTALILPVIESEFAKGCNGVVVCTRRPGLVEKLERAGYAEEAKLMRKKLC